MSNHSTVICDIIRYNSMGDAYTTEAVKIVNMAAIDRLLGNMDRFLQPILYLSGRNTSSSDESQTMTVTGGGGKYCISVDGPGLVPVFAYFAEQRSDRVRVWTSDQGFTANGRYVVPDAMTALLIVSRWCDDGQKEDSIHWRSYTHDEY